ncbi:hypothetical protein [Prevotella sp. 10(H)]|uniref:hypothetical protein n=1 Tax=Prevotella sp. 10(H) TaxID=1158294 RepID=UPI0004A6B783|nr:hypothetical protein [Prevotella sp. 10(H)]
MVIKGLILVAVILLAGLFMIVAFFWAIVKWNNRKSRDTGCLLAILFLILAIISGIFLVYKGVNTVIEEAPKVKDRAILSANGVFTTYFEDSPYMNSLKDMQPADSIIPDTYFTYGGTFKKKYRIPLIYPYSINSNREPDYGALNDESGIKNISKEPNRAKRLISNITIFAFDKNFLIAKTVPPSQSDIKYIIFHFVTKETEVFDNETDMKRKAQELGFDNTKSMERVSTHYYNLIN